MLRPHSLGPYQAAIDRAGMVGWLIALNVTGIDEIAPSHASPLPHCAGRTLDVPKPMTWHFDSPAFCTRAFRLCSTGIRPSSLAPAFETATPQAAPGKVINGFDCIGRGAAGTCPARDTTPDSARPVGDGGHGQRRLVDGTALYRHSA